MELDRLIYRLHQFWLAVQGRPNPDTLAAVQQALSPAQYVCFRKMQLSEQAHAAHVLERMQQLAGVDLPQEIIAAALLHDVGKSLHPLRLWERAVIVLALRFFPGRAKKWGAAAPAGWRRPFVIALQHPAWGADLTAEAGSTSLTVNLVARHQEPVLPGDISEEARWLRLLQQADNAS